MTDEQPPASERAREPASDLAANYAKGLADEYGLQKWLANIEGRFSAALAEARRAGERAMQERCAQLLLNGRFLHDEAPAARLAREAAAAIRALPDAT